MDSSLAQPCKEPIYSEDSRNSNVGPSNFDVDVSHDANCLDETLEAPEMNAIKTIMEKQSNDGEEQALMMESRL